MLPDQYNNNTSRFLILAAILFLPAYLINLDMVQLIRDEAIRALVSFEMIQTGDYVTPTISGELYLKKPPLFNWILAFMFQLTGSYSVIVMRIPVILSIIFFAATIYYFTRKEFGNRIALVNALAFATYGRIIFYESLHGLIDITFSWITYTFFMLAWHFFRKEKFLALFLMTFAVTAVSYLLKGLPSLFFTATTLLLLLILGKRIKMLLNWRFFLGLLLFLIIVGGYYLVYFTRNPVEPSEVFNVLTGEVTRRTAVRFGLGKTLLHLLTYPFEAMYHFLPWSVLALVMFRKGSLQRIRKNPFLWYILLLFVINVIPYWTSPETYARYILMLVPLAMTIFFVLYSEYRRENHWICKWIDGIFGGLIAAAGLGGIIFLFHPATRNLPGIIPVTVLLFLSMGVILYFYRKEASNRFLWLAIGLLIFRIGFDFSIIPSWEKTHPAVRIKQVAAEVAAESAGKDLHIYWNPEFPPDPYFHYRFNNEIFTYYLSVNLGRVIRVEKEPEAGAYYLALKAHLEHEPYKLIRKLDPPLQSSVYLVEFTGN